MAPVAAEALGTPQRFPRTRGDGSARPQSGHGLAGTLRTRKAGSRFAVRALISVMQITRNQVAHHEKHVVHLIYKTRGLEKATDVKLIENLIE